MKLFPSIIVGLLLAAPAFAALPPLYQSVAEVRAIMDSRDVTDALPSGEAIVSVTRSDRQAQLSYVVKTATCTLNVAINYEEPRPGFAGPAQFTVDAGNADCNEPAPIVNPTPNAPKFSGRVLQAEYDSNSDEIVLELSFGGGCKEHDFELVFNRACGRSLPAACSATLLHTKGTDDFCEALLYKEFRVKVGNALPRPANLNIRYGRNESIGVLVD